MQHESIVVLDFGGQYNQLIARRVREAKVYCEVLPYNTPLEHIRRINPKGIILSGGLTSVYSDDAYKSDAGIFDMGIPVLGICYGMQFIVQSFGGVVAPSSKREFGSAVIHLEPCKLFNGVDGDSSCWMSHCDHAGDAPEGFDVLASTKNCPIAAIGNGEKQIYGIQFHPEVEHTEKGREILHNFLYDICGCAGDWTMSYFVEDQVERIRAQVGSGKVLCGLSGGVDSSVSAVIVHKAVGKQLTCILVDHGLLRKGEAEQVDHVFREEFDINLITVDAKERFLNRLKGVHDPETKRKIIGEEFIRVFEEEADKLGGSDFLVQGTIYPDVIESGAVGQTGVIKSHHNVGGLPNDVKFRELIEPLRSLFKDEVRAAGLELGISEDLVWRQPFPGPGLAVRTLGEVTEDRLSILREADAIFREEVAKAGLARKISQYFAVILDQKTVGVMGDGRTYSYIVALRGVVTNDFMTADWARIPLDVLAAASSRIVNEVPNVNRVVYDITAKPPATIEWE